jgi:hypothetical protein
MSIVLNPGAWQIAQDRKERSTKPRHWTIHSFLYYRCRHQQFFSIRNVSLLPLIFGLQEVLFLAFLSVAKLLSIRMSITVP